ncbi:amidohydrolase family protein [Microbacterium sp. HJ5]
MHADPFALRALLGASAAPSRRAISGESGVTLPPLIDHHVHLHLIDERALPGGGIAGVVDLGGDPVGLARRPVDGMPRVSYAGAFLTAPGGYPSGRPWAPDEIVRIATDPSDHPGVPGGAATAVGEQASFGASVIKVALNAAAGPVFDPAMLDAIVSAARGHGLPVVAHVEGERMTRLALDAGVDALAHTPFTEALDDDLIGRAAAAGQTWISTLGIHQGDRAATANALANLEAFVAAGGTVLYGTDLGNGDRRVGVLVDELRALDRAGVRGEALVRALCDPWPAAAAAGVSTFVPGPPPAALDDVAEWLGRATVVPSEELIHDDH